MITRRKFLASAIVASFSPRLLVPLPSIPKSQPMRMFTSNDGITWTTSGVDLNSNMAPDQSTWTDIVFHDGVFVAVQRLTAPELAQ